MISLGSNVNTIDWVGQNFIIREDFIITTDYISLVLIWTYYKLICIRLCVYNILHCFGTVG